jgi:SAM-dependent methyltransferase
MSTNPKTGIEGFNPTTRFSDRVEDYKRCRPAYPAPLFDFLARECGLDPQSVIADIGSGTGIFTGPLLSRVGTVYAIEPNEAMRRQAERDHGGMPGFRSVAGTAETTQLKDASVDVVVAAQAFHWFDPAPARREFIRILRRPGWVALIWNDRTTTGTQFAAEFEELLVRFCPDYSLVNHRNVSRERIEAFFAPSEVHFQSFKNHQDLDFGGLQGRLLSASYCPKPPHPNYEPMMAKLRRIYDAGQREGAVRIEYDTITYFGQMTG